MPMVTKEERRFERAFRKKVGRPAQLFRDDQIQSECSAKQLPKHVSGT